MLLSGSFSPEESESKEGWMICGCVALAAGCSSTAESGHGDMDAGCSAPPFAFAC
jgi:hypothetical protein